MKKKIIVISIVTLFSMVFLPTTSYALDIFNNACSTGGADSAVCQDKGNGATNPLTGSSGLLMTITNIIALVAGIVSVIIIMISGWKYVTSGGEPSKAQAAKNTLIYALVGLAVIAVADVIIRLVLSNL